MLHCTHWHTCTTELLIIIPVTFRRRKKSVRAFEKLDKDHRNPDSSLLLSNILLAENDYAGAGSALEAYLKLVPDAPNAVEIKKQLKELNDMNLAKKQ